MAEFEPCAHVCAECGGCDTCCPGHEEVREEQPDPTSRALRAPTGFSGGEGAPAPAAAAPDQWRQAASQHARDKRTQRGRRPPPAPITGIRIDPRRQP